MINDKVYIITDRKTNTEPISLFSNKDERTNTFTSLCLFTALCFFWLGNIQDDGRGYRSCEKGPNTNSVNQSTLQRRMENKKNFLLQPLVTDFFFNQSKIFH